MKNTTYNLFLFCFLVLTSISVSAQSGTGKCNPKPIIKENKKFMKPYDLDSYTETELNYATKSQTVEVLFNAFSGEYYKLMFCGGGIPQEVSLKIYDKNKKAKKRTELYKTVIKPGTKENLVFEAKKPGAYFIEFDVPASLDTSEVLKGCVITLIGIKEME